MESTKQISNRNIIKGASILLASTIALQGCGDGDNNGAALTTASNVYNPPSHRGGSTFSTPVDLWGMSSSTIDVWFKNAGNQNDKMTVIFDTGSNPFFILGKTGMGYSKTRDIYDGKCVRVVGENGQPIEQTMKYADGSGFESELCDPSSSTIELQDGDGGAITAEPAFYQIHCPDGEQPAMIKSTKQFFRDSMNSGILGAGYSQPQKIFETTLEATNGDMNFYTTALDKIFSDNSMDRKFGVQMCPAKNEDVFKRNDNGDVTKPLNTGGHLDFGYFNSTRYNGDIQWTNVDQSAAERSGMWCVTIEQIQVVWPDIVNNPYAPEAFSKNFTVSKQDLVPTSNSMGTGSAKCESIIDTGNDIGITLVPSAYEKVLAAYGKIGVQIPVDALQYMPTMFISFANADGSGIFDVKLPPSAVFRSYGKTATFRVVKQDSNNNIGHSLLATYYAAFDRSGDKPRVGFAPLNGCKN